MAAYLGEELKPGLEYGGTPKDRTLNDLFVSIRQAKGESVPLVMGAQPPDE